MANRAWQFLGLMLLAAPAHAQVYNWATLVDGNWSDPALWSPAGVPDIAGESAVLGLAGPYTVTLNANPSIDALTLTNTDAVLYVSTNRTLAVGTGGITNNGTIIINGAWSGLNSVIDLFAGGTIGGTGEIVMQRATSDALDAYLHESGGFGIFHTSGHTISGSGLIEALLVNDGLIVANDPLRALELVGTISQGATGVLRADGATLGIRSIAIDGALIEGINGGVVSTVGNDAVLSNLTIEGEAAVGTNHTLSIITPGVVNNGTLTINPDASGFNSFLSIDSDATIAGAGQIVMVRATTDVNDAVLMTGAGATATIGANQTVRGSGLINGTFVNRGAMIADDPAQSLNFEGTITQTPAGTITGDGATAFLTNVTVSGGSLTSANSGIVDVAFGTTATLDGVTNTGTAGIRGNGTMALAVGGLTNNDTLTVNSIGDGWNATLRFDADATLDGTGTVVLNQVTSDVFDAQLTTAAGVVGTNGPDHTISGRGRINGDFINNGTILADVLGADLQVYGTMDQAGGGVMVGDSGFLALGDVTVTGGTLNSTNGGLVDVLFGTTATLSGVTNLGEAGIRGNGIMAIGAGGLTNEGMLVVNTLSDGWNAVLRFDADAVLDGAGLVVLNQITSDVFDAQVITEDGITGTNGADHTISGRGYINGDFINNGTIVADIEGTDLVVRGTYDQSLGGVMRGDAGFVALDDGAVTGGTFDGNNGGRVDIIFGGEVFVADVTMTGTNGVRGNGIMALTGGITNDGTLTVNSNGDGWNSELRADADVVIGGTGEVVLNQITSDSFDAWINATAFSLTIGADQTLSGRGRLDGDIASNGTISPGIAGTSTIQAVGTLAMGANHTYEVEIGSLAGANYDRITGSAIITLDGELSVAHIDAYEALFGESFPIITGSDITGTFSTLTAPPLSGALLWKVRYDATETVLVVSCPADTNIDGTVNTLDFLSFLNAWTAGDESADWNGDGSVNTLDFLAFLNEWVAGCS